MINLYDFIMKINIRVIPNSKKDVIVKENEKLKIHLKAKAVNNEANKYLIEILSEYFNVKKNNVKIVKGLKSREKIIEVL